MHNPYNPAATVVLRETEKAICALGLEIEASTAEEFEQAFAPEHQAVKGD